MSKKSRNSRFERKSGKKAESGDNRSGSPRRSYGTKAPTATMRPQSPKNRKPGSSREGGAGWIWGQHAAAAALANPKRTIHTILMTENARARVRLPDNAPLPKIVAPQVLDKQLNGSAHQGIALKAAPLEWPDIDTLADDMSKPDSLILVLDQITDPHNVGAMLRLCSAFGVSALIMQDRKAPPLSGATAKVAVGCLETIPVCLVTNVANTLQSLQKRNWMVTGLAGETDLQLSQALSGGGNQVIVMGAEGPGLRPRVRDCCDQLAKIPMLSSDVSGEAESLNVATAAGIALYEARRTT